MALIDILNKIQCGTSGALGTGTKWCDFNPNLIAHLVLLSKGTKLSLDEDFDTDAFEALQLAGKAVVLKNSKNFEDNSAENTKQTYAATGAMSLVRRGLYEFTMTYEEGLGFYKAMQSLNSNGAYDVILVDIEGNWLLVSKDDYAKGFGTNYVASNGIKFNTGSESTFQTISFQLSNSKELDAYSYVITAEESLVDISDVDGANELVYTWNTDPATTDTTVLVNVKSLVNSNIDIADLLDGDTDSIVVNVNGVDEVPTAVAKTSAGVISATISALSASDKVYVYGKPFKIDDSGIYQAKASAIKTVA